MKIENPFKKKENKKDLSSRAIKIALAATAISSLTPNIAAAENKKEIDNINPKDKKETNYQSIEKDASKDFDATKLFTKEKINENSPEFKLKLAKEAIEKGKGVYTSELMPGYILISSGLKDKDSNSDFSNQELIAYKVTNEDFDFTRNSYSIQITTGYEKMSPEEILNKIEKIEKEDGIKQVMDGGQEIGGVRVRKNEMKNIFLNLYKIYEEALQISNKTPEEILKIISKIRGEEEKETANILSDIATKETYNKKLTNEEIKEIKEKIAELNSIENNTNNEENLTSL
jgi:hypothetical protein